MGAFNGAMAMAPASNKAGTAMSLRIVVPPSTIKEATLEPAVTLYMLTRAKMP